MPLDPKKIRDRRDALTLTQTEAAMRAGWKGPAGQVKWTRLETGEFADTMLSNAENVARVLQCTIDELLVTPAPPAKGQKRSSRSGSAGSKARP